MADGASPVSKETIQALTDLLLDAKKSISERFRALFSLRNLKGEAAVVTALIMAMKDESNLLAHEVAFALGQMQDISAVPALIGVLTDQKGFHPIVRHEAAEALGAIGAEEGLEHLRWALVHDSAQEVRETCELALKRISERHVLGDQGEGNIYSPYLTVDPAMSSALPTGLDDESLKRMLLNEDMPMYDRYAALFALRNRGEDNVNAIVAALDAKSALLRHEVAYVLGQMQDKCSSAALSKTLEDVSEHPMVRHEAAEALGAIADANSIDLLKKFAKDPEPIVHQSCEVALTMLEFERNGNVFEFFFQEILSM